MQSGKGITRGAGENRTEQIEQERRGKGKTRHKKRGRFERAG